VLRLRTPSRGRTLPRTPTPYSESQVWAGPYSDSLLRVIDADADGTQNQRTLAAVLCAIFADSNPDPLCLLGKSDGAPIALRSGMEHNDEDLFLMQQLAPNNIVGVHNYCDGWCERCGFANRCVINMSRPPEEE